MSSDLEDRLEEMEGMVAQLPLNYICQLDRYFSFTDISIAIHATGIQHRNDFNAPSRMARASSFASCFCMAV